MLGLAPVEAPRILFLPTASGDANAQINAFQARFAGRTCIPEHLSLFRLREERRSLQDIVLAQDIVYVSGGSMRNLLAIWSAHGLDRLLVGGLATRHRPGRAERRGDVLVCRRHQLLEWPARAYCLGMGLLEGSLTVHADGEPERLPVWLAAVRSAPSPGGWAVDDGVGLLFRGRRLERVVNSRPGAGAQRVDAIAGELVRKRPRARAAGHGRRRVAIGAR